MSKSTKLASIFADLDNTAPKDYDPEDILEPLNDQNDVSEDEVDQEESGARDHYVSVGKSKLRNEQPLLDDPRYSGKRTSRKDIYSEDEQEDQSDDMSGSGEDINDDDEDLLANAHTYKDDFDDEQVNNDSEQDNNDSEQVNNDSEQDNSDSEQVNNDSEQDNSDSEQDNSDSEQDNSDSEDDVNAELKKIQEEEKQMISQLSKSAQSDVEKGQHVRQQLTLWDNCLENRIRMQKLMDDANKLPQKDTWVDFMAKSHIEEDLEATKHALRDIIDDLMDMRSDLFKQNGAIDLTEVRKRRLNDDDDDDDEYLDSLWKDMTQINDVFVPFRNSTLEKWSNKVQVAAGARLNKKFKAFDQNIMTQIQATLADKPSLIKRTQLQRSDYKILGKVHIEQQEQEEDTGKKPDRHLNTYDVEIFDDQDFYQQQLRELIESRMVDTDDPLAIGMRWAARKQTEQKKKKKAVNRKASKGRQLRFNVHEKLQNFMAPIPVGDWHESMMEELYTSLLGQRLDGDSLAE